MTENWQPLSCICNSLGRPDHPLYRALAHADYPKEYRLLALESALRHGKVPLRGCRVNALGLGPPERIETKIDVDTAVDISLDEVALSNRYDSAADLDASWRPHERPTKVIESTAPEWMPSDETRAEIAAMIPRNGPPRFQAVDVIENAVFQHVEADIASVEQWLRENYLPAEPLAIGAPETSAPKPRARPQRDKAKRLLQNMFPKDMPPKDKLPPGALIAKCKGPEWDGLKRDSIGRAAKELREEAARK
jgi:hypothetical protein